MNPTGAVRAMTFDVGGTLIEPWPSVGHVYAEVARASGLSKHLEPSWLNTQFAAAWKDKVDFNYSRPAWAELVCRTFGGSEEEFGINSRLFQSLYDRFTEPDVWRVYEDVQPTLQALRDRGFKLAVLSNWDERLRPLLHRLQLDNYFETIIVSAEVGSHKPAPAIFEHATLSLKVPAEEILHVGDSAREDLEGASKAGLQSILLRRRPATPQPRSISSLIELLTITGDSG